MTRLMNSMPHLAAALTVSAASVGAWAGLGAHEHGVGDLSVAVDDHRFELLLMAPTGDLVGMERSPATAEEVEAIRKRVEALEGGGWFLFHGDASCTLTHAEVELPRALRAQAHADHDHGHGSDKDEGHSGAQDHGHSHSHSHSRDQEHGHGHEHHNHHHDHDDAAEHMDGTVTWHYECARDVRISSMTVELFDLLPLTLLRVQAITDSGQGAARLSPANRRFDLP